MFIRCGFVVSVCCLGFLFVEKKTPFVLIIQTIIPTKGVYCGVACIHLKVHLMFCIKSMEINLNLHFF